MPQDKKRMFNLLKIIIILLVGLLVIINLIFIKGYHANKHYILTSIFTIILLVWATAFWLVVINHKDKK